MSMLAERRTKKKWCLNPNGKDWSNDNNKFGQRMLEKMGWKKGCGLGVNLQGMKEHVKVSAKNDTKGLGCKNSSDNEWIHHQQNFESLLSELASSTCEEIRPPGTSETKPVSLEEKSKKSRARVHYQKFTRGKDVSRYSANDLACIFGKKYSSANSKSSEIQYSYHTNTVNISEADSEDGVISAGVACIFGKKYSSANSKSSEIQYSYHTNTVNISEADSEDGVISAEHTVGRSLNVCEEKTIDDCLSSHLPKHRVKGEPGSYRHEDKDEQEKQNDILKEISNVNENSVTGMDIDQEWKSEIEDNSASHSLSESLEKIRFKRKRKHAKDSQNNQQVFTATMISSSQIGVSECDTVAHEGEEMDKNEEDKKKKKKNKKKDKKNKPVVEHESDKEGSKILIKELTEVTSDAEEIGNKDSENASMISEADTRGSKIKVKKVGKPHKTQISEGHKGPPEMKKRKKKKMCSQYLNESDVVENITSEIVSPSSPDNRAGVNNIQRSIGFFSESVPSYKEEPHQYDIKSVLKPRKAIKKHHSKSMDFGFKGSNLDRILGYGSLSVA
ncbi:PIN2/TERF1-interacting telomerase inhibitor 1 isoform X1 [Schistocerca americana]|uniref:PIN2/TERF1-interacting telomerase inhibitor 1 isoform X1 n=1 Tax=Schistocerca americana TaxID=7009 RepID=UPI001F4F95FC|nr:PIN2/TERF1-interacting telomerase inhibitor 1 isoform X1 [Schistocerca americana]